MRKAEMIPPTIVRKAVEVAIVAVRAAVINDRTKFAAIKHPRPGTKYRQTRPSRNKRYYTTKSDMAKTHIIEPRREPA